MNSSKCFKSFIGLYWNKLIIYSLEKFSFQSDVVIRVNLINIDIIIHFFKWM